MDDERGREEEQPRKIRVVDKRISARRESEAGSEPGPEIESETATSAPQESPVADEPPSSPEEAATVTPLRPPPAAPAAEHPSGGATAPREPPSPPPASDTGEVWTPEQEQEARRMADEMAQIPSLEWVINVSVTLANAAGTKLNAGSAEDAALAIDALAAIVEKVGPRMGDAETPLRQTLAQLQMAYAERVGNPQGPVQ
jgi:hypothetical protein